MFRGEIEKKERSRRSGNVSCFLLCVSDQYLPFAFYHFCINSLKAKFDFYFSDIKGRWSLDAQLREASGLTPGSDEIVFLITCLLY